MLGRRYVLAAAVMVLVGLMVLVALAAPGAGSADSVGIAAPPLTATPAVLEVKVVKPARVRVQHRRFVPWGEPSPAQAHRIAAIEAARAGVSLAGLESRITCESGWQWNNEYPVYHEVNSEGHYGLGQFMVDTFNRGVSTLGSRRVVMREVRERPAVAKRVRVMSDGTEAVAARWRVRQKVVRISRGMLPRDPPLEHGWVQVRIMAEAMAGRSAVSSSEWSCSA